ncbi:MAG: lipid A deacylase LpxR family protein [Caulobacteraceae bacterium]|nr:lipid A deacylase LpxR family protein [Caulobacteraceae bacterium]
MGHSLFTPNDTTTSAPLPDQHPYAAWLYGEYTALVEQGDEVDQVSVQLGIVGPSAGGEWVQNEFHALIGTADAQGWDNQLEDEIGIVISYDHRLRRLAQLGDGGFGADVTPNLGFTVGNIHTNLHAGLTLRMGQDLDNDYGPPRISPRLAGAGYFTPRDNFSWYVFASIEGRAVAHNIFLDGSLFRDDDPSVSSNTFVTDMQGLVVQVLQTQVASTYVERAAGVCRADRAATIWGGQHIEEVLRSAASVRLGMKPTHQAVATLQAAPKATPRSTLFSLVACGALQFAEMVPAGGPRAPLAWTTPSR